MVDKERPDLLGGLADMPEADDLISRIAIQQHDRPRPTGQPGRAVDVLDATGGVLDRVVQLAELTEALPLDAPGCAVPCHERRERSPAPASWPRLYLRGVGAPTPVQQTPTCGLVARTWDAAGP